MKVRRFRRLPAGERCEALAIGRHEGLGAASSLQGLLSELIESIPEAAAPWVARWAGVVVGDRLVGLMGGGVKL